MKILQRLFLLSMFCFLSTFTFAQHREIGFRVPKFNHLTEVGFIYKQQLNKENRYLRVSGANINILVEQDLRFQSNINLGYEKRKFHGDRFAFIHGWTAGGIISSAVRSRNDIDAIITPNLGYLLGMHYQISERFYVNIEANPILQVQYRNGNWQSARLNANANQGAIWLVYQF